MSAFLRLQACGPSHSSSWATGVDRRSFFARGIARLALEDILSDEPAWTGLFYVLPVEREERDVSPD